MNHYEPNWPRIAFGLPRRSWRQSPSVLLVVLPVENGTGQSGVRHAHSREQGCVESMRVDSSEVHGLGGGTRDGLPPVQVLDAEPKCKEPS